jgi:hypothetical protein
MVAQSDKLLVHQWYLIFYRRGWRSGQYLQRFWMRRCHSVALCYQCGSQFGKGILSSVRISHDKSDHAIAKPLLRVPRRANELLKCPAVANPEFDPSISDTRLRICQRLSLLAPKLCDRASLNAAGQRRSHRLRFPIAQDLGRNILPFDL